MGTTGGICCVEVHHDRAVELEHGADHCICGRNDNIDPVIASPEKKDLLDRGGHVFITCLVVSFHQVPSLAVQEVDHLTGMSSRDIDVVAGGMKMCRACDLKMMVSCMCKIW